MIAVGLPNTWVAANRSRLLNAGLDIDELPNAAAVRGPALLPLSCGSARARACLWYVEYGDQRYAIAVVGDPRREPLTNVRIESACLFGHVFGSEQCDCGWQWRFSTERILTSGGVLVYAVDQDARGLGIAAHFDIYQLRQQERLDTEEVFRRLQAPWDSRDYTPVLEMLRAVGVRAVRLLSNNPHRVRALEQGGFTVERAAAEAELTVSNMSTLMLEKEDLGYAWSFHSHAEFLAPLQARVQYTPEVTAAALAMPGGPVTAEVDGTWDTVADAVVSAADRECKERNSVLYLTDLPRAQDLAVYAHIGVQVIVVPYPTLPDVLIRAADWVNIRLVDWSRTNAWSSPRPQWVPVSLREDRHDYRRAVTDLHLPPPEDAPRLTRSPA